MKSGIIFLALQLTLIQHLPYISCQQFTFNNNAPVPSRFLVPGAFSSPLSGQSTSQSKRLLSTQTTISSPQPPQSQQQFSDDDEVLRAFRKPLTRTRPGISQSTNHFALNQEQIFADQPSRSSFRPTHDARPTLASKPVSENVEENTEEVSQYSSVPVSTFEPTPVNTLPLRTLRPSGSTLQSRPTKQPSPLPTPFSFSSAPPNFFRPSTNLVNDEEEEEDDEPSLQTSATPVASTEYTAPARRPVIENSIPVQKFQRKPTPIHRINNVQSRPTRIQSQPSQQAPVQPEFVDNKIVRQYEKVPVKSKFEKPEVPEKRAKKPVAQILRRYREDNPDGSITWGFENDDGSFKEETIGNDCITRGKYGYIDPDGVRREYSYSQGLPCDKTKTEQEEEVNQQPGYIDYSRNKVVLANGESVDLDNMVKNRQRKPVHLRN